MTKVTQADREAAAKAVEHARPIFAEEIRAGRQDDYQGVQAFALHRIAALEEAGVIAKPPVYHFGTVEDAREFYRDQPGWHEIRIGGIPGIPLRIKAGPGVPEVDPVRLMAAMGLEQIRATHGTPGASEVDQ